MKIKVYKTIILILPAVFYVCETWFPTPMKIQILRQFKNRVLRRISGHKGAEVTREWRKMHNEDLYNF
jgi:hypothetical protein